MGDRLRTVGGFVVRCGGAGKGGRWWVFRCVAAGWGRGGQGTGGGRGEGGEWGLGVEKGGGGGGGGGGGYIMHTEQFMHREATEY